MNESEARLLLEDYFRWLKDRTSIKSASSEWVEITTPFLDPHNDCLQIYVRKQGDSIELSDDGYTINDLLDSGVDVTSGRRRELLDDILRGFGVKKDQNGALCAVASYADFPQKKNALIQAMFSINDLLFLAAPHIESLFYDDILGWFDSEGIRYTKDIKFAGRSGYDQRFDFVISGTKRTNTPERIVQTMTNPKKDSANALMFRWQDVRGGRPPETQMIAILNDREKPVPKLVTDALKNYDILPINWSQKDECLELLAA